MKNEVLSISSCEVCGHKELADVIDLGLHPMCDDLVELKSDRACKEFPIVIAYCKNCNTAHQKFQIPKHELFPSSYHYRSRFTSDVLKGMQDLVNECEEKLGKLTGKKVLDVGCNDGSLLSFFREKGAATYGLEPTDAYLDAQESGHIVFNEYLTTESAKKVQEDAGTFDIITFTNVFAHIEDLDDVLRSLKILSHQRSIIVIENHYLGAVIAKNQFDTFYHEHPRTYSLTSFAFIANNLGLRLLGVDFPSRYGGNIRVMLGEDPLLAMDSKIYSEVTELERDFFVQLVNMNSSISIWRSEKKAEIERAFKLHGRLRAKAFPGRAAILVKLLDLDETVIEAVYEKPGSMKIGHYVPGTRIPIRSDEELFSKIERDDVILNLAWHISGEIEEYLRKRNFKGEILNIL